jgi:uncharacterized protein YbjT (DUF2867 family)
LARVLIVGCGCRGRSLASALAQDGHAVRGTTRDEHRRAEMDAAGVEAVVADPDRLGTLMPHLAGVSAVCWLMGPAVGTPEELGALHGPRLRSFLELLVDTPVRGAVYEPHAGFPDGVAIAHEASRTWAMPIEILEPAADHGTWLAAARSGVARVLEA